MLYYNSKIYSQYKVVIYLIWKKYCSFCGRKLNSDNSVCDCNKKYNVRQIKYGTCLATVLGISFIYFVIVGILSLILNAFSVSINQSIFNIFVYVIPIGGVVFSPIIAVIMYVVNNK